jgi:hypothetical protein
MCARCGPLMTNPWRRRVAINGMRRPSLGAVLLIAACAPAAATPGGPPDARPDTGATSAPPPTVRMRAGLALDPEARQRCHELEEAFVLSKPIEVLPPERPLALRTTPRILSDGEMRAAMQAVGIDPRDYHAGCFVNKYAVLDDDVVVDRATGLMWERRGTRRPVALRRLKAEVLETNRRKVHGFADWRLPTVDEVATLIDSATVGGGAVDKWLFGFRFIWTADLCLKGRYRLGFYGEMGDVLCFVRDEEASLLLVRTVRPDDFADDRPHAGLAKDPDERRRCLNAERARFALGRKVEVLPSPEPARLRSTPIRASVDQIREKLTGLGLASPDGSSCFSNLFVVNPDDTVTDRATGLMWERDYSPGPMPCTDAASYVSRRNRARYRGHDDWRLPTAEEIATLRESAQFLAPISSMDADAFPGADHELWIADQSTNPDPRHTLDYSFGTFGVSDVSDCHDSFHWVKLVRTIGSGG